MPACARCGSLSVSETSGWRNLAAAPFTQRRHVICSRCRHRGWSRPSESGHRRRRHRPHHHGDGASDGRRTGPGNPLALSLDDLGRTDAGSSSPEPLAGREELDLSALDPPPRAAADAAADPGPVELPPLSSGPKAGGGSRSHSHHHHHHRRHRSRPSRHGHGPDRTLTHILLAVFAGAVVLLLLQRACGSTLTL